MSHCYAIDILIGLSTRAYIRRFRDPARREEWVELSSHSREVVGARIARRLLGYGMYQPLYWRGVGLRDDDQEVPQQRLCTKHTIVKLHDYVHGSRAAWRFCRCSCGWASDGPVHLVEPDVKQHLEGK